MFQGFGGTQSVTADILVGRTGLPTRVFAIHLVSGGTASVIALRNGQAVGGTIWIQQTGTISTGKTFTFGQYGVLFPLGCFVDVDANISTCQISYAQEA